MEWINMVFSNLKIRFSLPKEKIIIWILTLIFLTGCSQEDKVENALPSTNASPSAIAGGDQSVEEKNQVVLSGEGSDADGTLMSYGWRQLVGTTVTLSSTNNKEVVFTAPDVDEETTLIFELVVTDDEGATATDKVKVLVKKSPVFLVAAGQDLTVETGKQVVLSGRVQGKTVSYKWTQLSGPSVTLYPEDQYSVSFIAQKGEYLFELSATNLKGDTVSDRITITSLGDGKQFQVLINDSLRFNLFDGRRENSISLSAFAHNGGLTSEIKSFRWIQVSGPLVELVNKYSDNLTIKVPVLAETSDLVFEAIAGDHNGNYGVSKITFTGVIPSTLKDIQAESHNQSVTLVWENIKEQFPSLADYITYSIYYAEESFGENPDLENYANYLGAGVLTDVSPNTHTFWNLINQKRYYFVFVTNYLIDINSVLTGLPSNEVLSIPDIKPYPSQALNDTGIDFGADRNGRNDDCTGFYIQQQDCSVGQDVTESDNSDGYLGFQFTKLDTKGSILSSEATEWECVEDKHTGLIWEVKKEINGSPGDTGLHDGDDTFTWYQMIDGSNYGMQNTELSFCYGFAKNDSSLLCNTHAFILRVNSKRLCGRSNWRLPDVDELHSIVNYGRVDPAIDTNFFPNTASKSYWTAQRTPLLDYDDYGQIFIIDFYSGGTNKERLSSLSKRHVRLVSSKNGVTNE